MSLDLSKVNTNIDSLKDLCASEKNILKYLVGIGSKVGDFSKISVSRDTIKYKVSLEEHPLRKCNITPFSTATKWDVILYMQSLIKKKYISIVAKYQNNIPYTYAVNMEKLGLATLSKVEDKKEIEADTKGCLARSTLDHLTTKIGRIKDVEYPSKVILLSMVRNSLFDAENRADLTNPAVKELCDKDYLNVGKNLFIINYPKIFSA